jgi:hypothetical protein
MEAAADRTAATRRTQSSGQLATQFNLAQILGSEWPEAAQGAKTASTGKTPLPESMSDALATATTPVVQGETGTRQPATALTPSSTAGGTAPATKQTTTSSSPAATATTETTPTASASGAAATTATAATTGIQALVSAIMNGTFQATYVTDPSQLQESTPAGTNMMPNFYFASDQTAQQLASLLGGTVVKMPPFGQDVGFSEPNANFIQLPNGQTVNAAGVAYYAKAGPEGAAQLTADLTATINVGAAWTNYYQSGGSVPNFPMGYVGPPISGMTYPAGTIGADGNVINPAMAQSTVATS